MTPESKRWPWAKFILPDAGDVVVMLGGGCGCLHCRWRLTADLDQDFTRLRPEERELTTVRGVPVRVLYERVRPYNFHPIW